MLCLRTFEGKFCPRLALAEWLSRSGIIYSLLFTYVVKYSNFSMCSALGNGGTRRAQQLWPGLGEGKKGLGKEGCSWGEVGAVPPVDGLAWGGEEVLCFPPHSARVVLAQQWEPSCDWNKPLLGGCLLGDGRIWVDVWVKDRNKIGRVGKRKIWLMGLRGIWNVL